MESSRHLTTRRGFVVAAGFGGVSLYGLWAAYGAAPNPLALLRDAGTDAADIVPPAGDAIAGHGGVNMAADVDAFRAEVARFIERFTQEDGTVYPRLGAGGPQANDPHMTGMDMSGADMAAAPTDGHASQDDQHGQGEDTAGAPVDIPMMAERWYFEPGVLRLDPGTAYRFRMMTADVTHGASIQFGQGARMIRLSPGTVAELELTFTNPGSYLVYCTSYCGAGHDGMQARIVVA